MIHVKPNRAHDGEETYRKGFIVEGHADFAKHGQDIVCAGVSAVVQTAMVGLEHYNPISAEQREGYVKVNVHEDDHTSDAIIKTMLLGLRLLSRQYPEYIQIRETYETM